jgi:peptidyl-dipeptidase Dcp
MSGLAPGCRVWEVRDADGKHKALFYGDYFARPSKRSGAWMTSLRDQQKLDGEIAPLIINVCNFARGASGEPSLLSPDDARTLFHEFGHGLHGMLSNVTYPSLSGTSVFTDFVELPSQLYEHWQEQPQVLRQFAKHYQTGEPLPDELLARFLAARKFNQGFATVEFVSSALIDLEFHTQPAAASRDVAAFEKAELEKIGMPAEIALRHRPTQFGHIFSGDHYASGYYSYMWSEVMDADAFGAFEEAGDIFDPATAKRLHDDIYSSGGSRDRRMPMSPSAAASRRPRCGAACRPAAGYRASSVRERGTVRPWHVGDLLTNAGLCPRSGRGVLLGCGLHRSRVGARRAGPSACLDHRQERGGLCARRLDHGRPPRLDL